MKISSFLFTVFISNISIIPYVQANDTSGHGSLKEFCIAEEKDTRENCECGQTTADRIMSPQEQPWP